MLTTLAQTSRRVRIPAGRSPGWFRCPVVDPNVSARCLNDSPALPEARERLIAAATYQPLPYLVPAAISRIRVHPDNLDSPDACWEGARLTDAARRGYLPAVEPTVSTGFPRGPGCWRYTDGGVSIGQLESKRVRNHVCSCLHQLAAPSIERGNRAVVVALGVGDRCREWFYSRAESNDRASVDRS